jgi:hypothetical protein
MFLACAFALACSAASQAYTFGADLRQTGSESTVFDWTNDACEQVDIPDLPARAFRDADNRTQLISTHYVSRRFLGWDLNGVRHKCDVLMRSNANADPAAFDDRQWLSSPFTIDGRTVYALVHHEYQGWRRPDVCDPNLQGRDVSKCLWDSVAFAVSHDGGATYSRTPAPEGLVATDPYVYDATAGPAGIGETTNIVYRADGYYYVLAGAYQRGAQQAGSCVLRTRTLSDPTSWRAWDGSSFSIRFIDPYIETSEPPEAHVCTPVTGSDISTSSLTYNTYFGKYLLTGTSMVPDPQGGPQVRGFFYSTSDDLVHWSTFRLLMQGNIWWDFTCGDPDPVLYPSLLDPTSPSRNYSISGQRNYLYFTRFNMTYYPDGCSISLDRDLIRIPVEFTAPRGPASLPSCSRVKPSPSVISVANGRMANVTVRDPNAAEVVEITSVTQDEPTTDLPDAIRGTTPDTVRLRAYRRAGDGRVYKIWFTATGGNATCWGVKTVSVPTGGTAIDSSPPAWDSLNPSP